jgi:uroporphyrinogen decarboxylase
MLTHTERMKACLADDAALDRTPAALWRHFPVDDQAPETLAAAVVHFQREYDFDLVKVTPASSFCIKDWGVDDVWEGHSEGTRRYTKSAIGSPRDWEHLRPLDPRKARGLAAQLACLRLIRAELGPDIPVLQTIFSPLAQAKHLVDGDKLVTHLRLFPDAVMKGLETIAVSTRRFIEAALETGIDGIFYAIQHAQAGVMSLEEYKTFGLPFDLQTLQPAKSLWCNLLHLHGLDVYFDLVTHYSSLFSIVNWHDRETPPSLAQAQTPRAFAKLPGGAAGGQETPGVLPVLCGGVSQDTIVFGNGSQVRKEAEDAILQTRGRRFILGTGCVVPIIAPHGNIQAVVDASHRSAKGKK